MEKQREGNIDVREKYQSVASPMCPEQGLNLQPGHMPRLESNWQPFPLWDGA